MVELWREKLGDVPFITVQLNRWAEGGVSRIENDRYWGTVRDAQRRLAEDIPGVHIISVMDIPMSMEFIIVQELIS